MGSSARSARYLRADIHPLKLFDGISARLGDKEVAQVRRECRVANFQDS